MVPITHSHFAAAHRCGDDALGGPAEVSTTKQMIPDIDIWRCAALMIKQYGDAAAIEAAARADEYREKGELDGERVWTCITEANR